MRNNIIESEGRSAPVVFLRSKQRVVRARPSDAVRNARHATSAFSRSNSGTSVPLSLENSVGLFVINIHKIWNPADLGGFAGQGGYVVA